MLCIFTGLTYVSAVLQASLPYSLSIKYLEVVTADSLKLTEEMRLIS